ncbi:MAG: hypothetical protein MJA30_27885 [Cytophagales bacterium]|nr:hypothetical protein [Cytophagales bacterium]
MALVITPFGMHTHTETNERSSTSRPVYSHIPSLFPLAYLWYLACWDVSILDASGWSMLTYEGRGDEVPTKHAVQQDQNT